MEVVPEFGFGNDGVGGKDDHTVSLRVWMLFGGLVAADHLKLTHFPCNCHDIFFSSLCNCRSQKSDKDHESDEYQMSEIQLKKIIVKKKSWVNATKQVHSNLLQKDINNTWEET